MPTLTGVNTARPSVDDEHPFRLLARVSGRRFGRGVDGRLDARAGVFLGSRTIVALRVEQHLAHGQRLNGHGRRVLAGGGDDLGRAGEAGTDVGHLLVERDHRP